MLRARLGDIEFTGPPDRNDEYLFYQLLVGSWPAEMTCCDTHAADEDRTAGAKRGANAGRDPLREFAERLKRAMIKSIREAKVHSTWAAPNLAYEEASLAFVDSALDPGESKAFLAAFLPFQRQVARLGMENSLAQTVLKLTMPGVPDIYQGAELWDLSLVDPDNRRPVDYELRRGMLEDLDARKGSLADLLDRWQDGAVKLFVTRRILQFRREDPGLFESGDYEPLQSFGAKADCVCGFARIHSDRAVLVIIARFPARREQDPDWRDTTVALPQRVSHGTFQNIFTGARFTASDVESAIEVVFDGCPVAVLALNGLSLPWAGESAPQPRKTEGGIS
jgi:(1->4)-alpha-D-glucan 1-alpha-D-glucosylmutase